VRLGGEPGGFRFTGPGPIRKSHAAVERASTGTHRPCPI
jgi:hypothetical protein